jgi:hypothetical protein
MQRKTSYNGFQLRTGFIDGVKGQKPFLGALTAPSYIVPI